MKVVTLLAGLLALASSGCCFSMMYGKDARYLQSSAAAYDQNPGTGGYAEDQSIPETFGTVWNAIAPSLLEKEINRILNPCDPGYIFFPYTGYCYLPVTQRPNRTTWTGARDACKLKGAVLASFHSRLEQQFFNKICTASKPNKPNSNSLQSNPKGGEEGVRNFDGVNCWVGGSSDSKGVWKWEDGSTFGDVPLLASGNYNYETREQKPENSFLAVYYDDDFGAGAFLLPLQDTNEDKIYDPLTGKEQLNYVCQKPAANQFSADNRTEKGVFDFLEHLAQNEFNILPNPFLGTTDSPLAVRIQQIIQSLFRPILNYELAFILNPCKPDWIFYPETGKCYFHDYGDERTFYGADMACKAVGARLPSFHSRAEQQFLKDLCTASGIIVLERRRSGKLGNPEEPEKLGKRCWVGGFNNTWLDGSVFGDQLEIMDMGESDYDQEECYAYAVSENDADGSTSKESYCLGPRNFFACEGDSIKRPRRVQTSAEKYPRKRKISGPRFL